MWKVPQHGVKIEYARRKVREVEAQMTKEKNHSWGTALRYVFPKTIPVMVGYLFLGTAYGILMSMNGFGVGWAFVISVVVFAGSLQYVGINLLKTALAGVNRCGLFHSLPACVWTGGIYHSGYDSDYGRDDGWI